MDDYMKAITFNKPNEIPSRVSFLPATWTKYKDELETIVLKHNNIFKNYKRGDYKSYGRPDTYNLGEHIDEWGCVWENLQDGCESMVKRHPVGTREMINDLKAPKIDTGSTPHGFMFLRLADLRGFEEAMIDFAEEPPELQKLIDIVLNYNLTQINIRLQKENSLVMGFGDDLGIQNSLPISPTSWRKYMKPCYQKMYNLCHAHGKYVYMHTDGHIYEIIPDLIECGVNVINPQIRANGIDNLVNVCKGKICVDQDLDRQMFPFCNAKDIDDQVKEVVMKLGSVEGGLMLIAECGPDVPLNNIDAICLALEKYKKYYTSTLMY